MSIAEFISGFTLLLLVVVPLALGAAAVRRRWLGSLRGASARVAEAVLGLGALTVLEQLLGLVGALQSVPIVAGSLALGAGAFAVTRWSTPSRSADVTEKMSAGVPIPSDRPSRSAVVLTAMAITVVAAQWLAQSFESLQRGMGDSPDTLWYHGPMAARFAQAGSITGIHHFDLNPVTSYYPGGSSLLHAGGILLFDTDVLSPLLNVSFFALAATAAWVIGRRLGSGPTGLLGALVVLGTPMVVGTQPGSEYNDVVGLAFILSSVALLLEAEGRAIPLVLAAAAAGMAAGTKLSMLAPVAALTIAVVALSGRGRRMRVGGMWLAGVVATGGFWYVRNIVAARSPLPGVELPLGPFAPPSIASPQAYTVASFLDDWTVVRDVYIPGLDRVLGAVWWAILLGVVVGGVGLAIRGRDRLHRFVGIIVVATFIAYLFTPSFIGPEALLFSGTVRFAIVPLTLGLIALSGYPRRAAGRRALLIGLALALAVTQLDASSRPNVGGAEATAAWLVVALSAIAVALLAHYRPRSRRALVMMALAGLALGPTCIWFVQRDQLENRYLPGAIRDLHVVSALEELRGARVATQGYFLQYPLYGPDLSNYVQYLGDTRQRGALTPLATCPSWKGAVNAGDYDYVLVAPEYYPVFHSPRAPAALGWAKTELGHGLRAVAHDGALAAVFEIRGRLNERTCR